MNVGWEEGDWGGGGGGWRVLFVQFEGSSRHYETTICNLIKHRSTVWVKGRMRVVPNKNPL